MLILNKRKRENACQIQQYYCMLEWKKMKVGRGFEPAPEVVALLTGDGDMIEGRRGSRELGVEEPGKILKEN